MLTDKAGDLESGYRETFRVFSKTASGCIPMEEIKFVLSQVAPQEVSQQSGPSLSLSPADLSQEAEQIVSELDKNGDGNISYTEFRGLLGANSLYSKTVNTNQ